MKSVKTTNEKATTTKTAKTGAAKTASKTAKTKVETAETTEAKTKAETSAEAPAEEAKTAPKTKTKAKSKTIDKSVKVGKSTTKSIIPLADMFPEELELFGVEFRAAREIKTYEDLLSIYESDEEVNIYIAAYWNKRHLKQYDYGKQYKLNNFKATKFENDLDMLNIVYVSDFEGEPNAIAISAYTGAIYSFTGNEIPEIVDEDEGYRLRVSNGMEYEIYVEKDADLSSILK